MRSRSRGFPCVPVRVPVPVYVYVYVYVYVHVYVYEKVKMLVIFDKNQCNTTQLGHV